MYDMLSVQVYSCTARTSNMIAVGDACSCMFMYVVSEVISLHWLAAGNIHVSISYLMLRSNASVLKNMVYRTLAHR